MKIRNILLFILILSIGISLRIYNLDKYDFWHDEIFDILIAKGIFHWTATDYGYLIDPPLFYLLLGFWLRLGNSEFVLRLLPSIFGVLCIIAIYFVGKKLFDKKVGLIASFILAISPFHIYYSQELRTYTLVTFLALMMVYYVIRSLRENKIIYWAGFVIFATLIIYSHNIAIFLIFAVNLYFFLFYKRHKVFLRRWLISQLFIFLFYLPWIKIVFEQISHVKASGCFQWLPNDHLISFIQTFTIFNLGYNAKKNLLFPTILPFSILFLLAIWDERNKEKICLLLCWLFIPVILVMVFSSFVFPAYFFRPLIYVSIAYYIIIAYGLSRLKPNKAYLYFLLFFSILSGFLLKNHYQNVFALPEIPYHVAVHPRKENRLGSDYISQNYQKGDIVGHTSLATCLPFLYYHNNRLEEKLFVLSYQNKFYFVYSKSEIIKQLKITGINLEGIKKSSYKRIWLVLSSWGDEVIDQLSKDIKEYLDRNYVMEECKELAGLTIYLYQIK